MIKLKEKWGLKLHDSLVAGDVIYNFGVKKVITGSM